MRASLLLLLLLPALAHAGVSYDLSVRMFTPSAPPRTVQRFFVEDGKVRVGASDAKEVFILKDKTLYMLDTAAHTVRIIERATLAEATAALNASTQRMRESFADLPPEKRDGAEDMARSLAAHNARSQQPEPSDYVITGRSETVDGHKCVIWERVRNNMKLREICVAPVSELPGGADLLAGLKTLSDYVVGSLFALGVNFGMSPWWSSIESLGGVPILVREFSPTGAVGYESTLTGMLHEAPNPSFFEIPNDYRTMKNDRPAAPAATAAAPHSD